MRRIVGYELLMFAVAVAFMAGCSNSSSPDLADGADAIGGVHETAPTDSEQAADAVIGENTGLPAGLAAESGAAKLKQEPRPAEIAEGADSDSPGGYQAPSSRQSDVELLEDSQLLNQSGDDVGAKKSDEGRADGDDPTAAILVPKSDEPLDEAPLDNGRESSAKPIAEGQRVAAASSGAEPEATELGREPNSKPGAESTSPPKATPSPKPAAPSRATLADLSEAIRALDKDADGQLGVYEWPREKLAEFKTLDADKDGFLTPAELVAGQKMADAKSPSTEEKPAAKPADDSAKDDAKAPAAESTDKEEKKEEAKVETPTATDKEESPDNSAAGADSKDEATAADQPTQGS